MSKTIWIIIVTICILITAVGALAAVPVIDDIELVTDFEGAGVDDNVVTTVEGVSLNYQIVAHDEDNDSLQYRLLVQDDFRSISVDENGLLTILADAGIQEGLVRVEVADLDADGNERGTSSSLDLEINVLPVLEISQMRVGTLGNMAEYEDGDTTQSFKPGKEVTFEITLRNRFTDAKHEIIGRDDVEPIIEDLALNIDTSDNNFNEVIDTIDGEPIFLNAQEEKVITFNYQIPFNAADADVVWNFGLSGKDQDVPADFFNSQAMLIVPVEQSSHEVIISEVVLDSDLTCEEKGELQNVAVELINIGAEDEVVTVHVFQEALGIDERSVIFVGREEDREGDVGRVSAEFQVSYGEHVGDVILNVEVYRTFVPESIYDSQSISIQVADCPVAFGLDQFALTFDEGATGEIDIVAEIGVSNVEDNQNLTYEISVNNNFRTQIAEGILTITPVDENFVTPDGEVEELELTISDGESEDSVTIQVTVNQLGDDALEITQVTPNPRARVDLTAAQEANFSITIANPDGIAVDFNWYVDDLLRDEDTENFTLEGRSIEGLNHSVKVIVNEGLDSEIEQTWLVQLVDRPFGFENFAGDETTEIENVADLEQVPLVLENAFGKISWNSPRDLSELFIDISTIVRITGNQVAVDSGNAGVLNGAATITLARSFTSPLIFRSAGFNAGDFVLCPNNVCDVVRNADGEFVFFVNGFSTYRVEEAQPAGLSISTITFDDVTPGTVVNRTVTVTNTGTQEQLTNVRAALENVNDQYSARIVGSLPATLNAQQSASVTLQISVPSDEESESHTIGSFVVTSNQANATQTITLDPRSFLEITSFKINGKTSGDLSVEEDNEFEVEVANNYPEDLEDVTVTVTILDVDDDDIDEESDEFDIDTGDKEEARLNIDLSNENIDEEEYTIQIEVEGEATDNTRHSLIVERTVTVDVEKHQLRLEDSVLNPSVLECNSQTQLRTTVRNVGQEDEDEVRVKITNTALGINLERDNIELDDFTSSRNDEEDVTFNLNIGEVRAGVYPIQVEAYRDNDLDDSETLQLTIRDCVSTQSTTRAQDQFAPKSSSQLAEELQQQLQARSVSVPASVPAVSTKSFRDTDSYLVLLGVLIVMVFIAVILAVTVMFARKR